MSIMYWFNDPKVEEQTIEKIPGLPYIPEERITAIHKAEENYNSGRFVTSDELRKKHPRI